MSAADNLLDLGPQNLQAAYLRSRVIQALFTQDTQDGFQAALNGLGITATISFYQGPGGAAGILRHALLTVSAHSYLFISGIETASQALSMWNSYLGAGWSSSVSSYGKSFAMQQWATAIATNVLPFMKNASAIFVCGHSAGGYAANVVSKLVAVAFQRAGNIQVCHFGTPKIGVSEQIPHGVARWHWYNDDDPVTTIPPVVTDTSAWALALSPAQIVNIGSFNQLNNGTAIDLNGNLINKIGPPGLPQPDWISAAAWILNTSLNFSSPHNIQTYSARLLAALNKTPGFNPTPPAQPDPEPQSLIRGREAADIHAEIVQTVFTSDQPPSQTVPTIPAGEAFNVLRSGKAYLVYFGETVVAVGPHRRTAHGLSRLGNAFLRRLQTEGRVDTTAMIQQLEAYLAEASSNPAFVPLMQIVPTD